MFETLNADQMLQIARSNAYIDSAIKHFFTTMSIEPVPLQTPSLEDVEEQLFSGGTTISRYDVDGKLVLVPKPPEKGFWPKLKIEFRILVCTDDKKYDSLRRQLKASSGKSQTVIVSAIAAAMAVHVGVIAGVLVPFCALCLFGILKLGQSAFCSDGTFQAVPVENRPPWLARGGQAAGILDVVARAV